MRADKLPLAAVTAWGDAATPPLAAALSPASPLLAGISSFRGASGSAAPPSSAASAPPPAVLESPPAAAGGAAARVALWTPDGRDWARGTTDMVAAAAEAGAHTGALAALTESALRGLALVGADGDPARAVEFRALMQESRRSRLRHGALSWELLQDINVPGRFVEMIEDESWTDHLRRFDRVTAADVALRDRKLAFHKGVSPPLVSRCVMTTTL